MHLILQMSIAICTCMIVSWTPYSIVSMWETYGDSSTLPVQLEAFSALVAKSSTSFTPLVHLFYMKKFSYWFKKFLFCLHVQNPPVPTTILVSSAAKNGLTLRPMNDIHGNDIHGNDIHHRSGDLKTSDCRIVLQTRSSSVGEIERASSSYLNYIHQMANEPIGAQRSTSFGSRSERNDVCGS
jgi:hypothetical protein